MKIENKVTIKIPRNLYNRLHQIVKDSGFNSVTDFIVFVLRDLVSESTQQRKNAQHSVDEELSKEEIELVRKRLKSLGYL